MTALFVKSNDKLVNILPKNMHMNANLMHVTYMHLQYMLISRNIRKRTFFFWKKKKTWIFTWSKQIYFWK